MEINLSVSVNGVPKAAGEMKQYIFASDAVEKAIIDVNKRLKKKDDFDK